MKPAKILLKIVFMVIPLLTINIISFAQETKDLVMPKTNKDEEWKPYLTKLIRENMGDTTIRAYVYYLSVEPSEEDMDFINSSSDSENEKQERIQNNIDEKYQSILEQTREQLSGGIPKGNLLAFISPNSEKMGSIITEVLSGLKPNSMQGARILFIGKPADSERVKPIIENTGADYIFIEIK